MRLIRILSALAAILGAWPAEAACSYRGVDGARTTLAQEFADSTWVVRVRVRSADYHWSDEGVSWTRYDLEVTQTFKGSPPRRISFFTERNSGGFYLDGEGAVPDLDHEYLLFLNPTPAGLRRAHEAEGGAFVNYTCGQSRRWDAVPESDRASLARLVRTR